MLPEIIDYLYLSGSGVGIVMSIDGVIHVLAVGRDPRIIDTNAVLTAISTVI